MNLYNKLSIIEFCKEEEVNIFEFTFGQELSLGHVNFGMVAISKENNVLDAISCLYTLNFQIATVLVTRRKKKRFAGINMGTSRRSWHEPKSLGFITQRAFVNFCRYKAMQEFNKRNLVTEIILCLLLPMFRMCKTISNNCRMWSKHIHKEERHFGWIVFPYFHAVFLEGFSYLYKNYVSNFI